MSRRLAGWVAVAVAAAVPALTGPTVAGPDRLDGRLSSPDLLSPAALYQDVVCDGYPAAGFRCSAATFAVPDYAAYFAARAVAPSHAAALPLWAGGQFLVLAAAGYAAARGLAAGRAWLAGVGVYLVGLAVGGFAAPDIELVLPVWHTGALAFALAGLAVGRRLIHSSRPAGWAVVLAGLTAVGVFSDRLVVPYLVAPAAVLLLAGWQSRRRAAATGLALVGGTAAGLAAIRLLLGDADPIDNYGLSVDLGRLGWRVYQLARVAAGEVAAGNRLLLGAAGWYLFAAWGCVRPAGRTELTAVRLFSLTAAAGTTAAFLLSRGADEMLPHGDWQTFGRYFVGPIGLAALGWVVWLTDRPRLGVAVAVGWLVGTPAAEWPAFDGYPERVRAVDAACRARGLTTGLGSYTDGKPSTLLSRAGLTVRQVWPMAGLGAGLTPQLWLGNADWYTRGPDGRPARFQFVLVGDQPDALPEGLVVARLGEPAERLPAGDRTVLVYDRPTDWRLARFASLDLPLLNATHEQAGGLADYPGAALATAAGVTATDTPAGDKVIEGGAAGVATHGPYLRVKRYGRGRATVRLTATTPGSSVEALWERPDGSRGRVLATAAVPVCEAEVPLDFDLTPRLSGGVLEFRLRYGGSGRVAVHGVRYAPP